MAVMISDDKKDLIVTCSCGCDSAIHIKIDKEDNEEFLYQTYMNGNWYRDQNDRVIRTIIRKMKKIWAIIRNKDFYYSEIIMSKEDFRKYKEYIDGWG